MNGILITSTVAPLLAAPSLASEQVSQMVLGEGAEILAVQGSMLRVRTRLDQYEGWLHEGYTERVPIGEVDEWLAGAAWSEGALLELASGIALRAPHRARLILGEGSRVRLPDGENADLLAGTVRDYDALVLEARTEPPAEWAWREFAGTPYLWGGITGAGIDCSGLVQNTFLARGTTLPRDAHAQAGYGEVVERTDRQAGDLLFFRGLDTERVTHVAMLAGTETIVHSAVDTGGVARESWDDGSRAAPLRERLVAVRRLA